MNMWSFLTFETLISTQVLIAFYYLGAAVMPILLFWFMLWFKEWLGHRVPVVKLGLQAGKRVIKDNTSWQTRLKWTLFFVVMFLFAELFWRLLFEFLIAYMQMRDALVMVAV